MEGQKIAEVLNPHLSSSTKVSVSASKAENVGRRRWTDWKAPTFSASVQPTSVQDLQTVVRLATANRIPFLTVSSAHGFNPVLGEAQDILEVDIRNFKDIHVDEGAYTVTIGGAVLHRDLQEELWKSRKQIPVGGCTTTGVVGVTLGGGVNRWQGVYGLLIDSLLSVQLVTANGELVTASKTENEELFWGIRGAGFNFGIVVSATYQIYDLINDGQIFVFDFILPFDKGLDVVTILKTWEDDQDPLLAVAVSYVWSPEMNGPCQLGSLLYMGPQEDGMKYAQKLIDLGPIVQNIYMADWNELPYKWGMGVDAQVGTYGGPKNVYSGHTRSFDLPTYEWFFGAIAKLWEEYPAARSSMMMIEDWPTKKTEEIPDEETAYPNRDVRCQMLILTATEDPSLIDMLNEWGDEARGRFQTTNGFGQDRTYVSYARGDESQEAMYGERKLERLRALKRKWDPEQMFSWLNPIKL